MIFLFLVKFRNKSSILFNHFYWFTIFSISFLSTNDIIRATPRPKSFVHIILIYFVLLKIYYSIVNVFHKTVIIIIIIIIIIIVINIIVIIFMSWKFFFVFWLPPTIKEARWSRCVLVIFNLYNITIVNI